jgi:hypothetical protein
VLRWRQRFTEASVVGHLKDVPRSGRHKTRGAKKIEAIVNATHWSSRLTR